MPNLEPLVQVRSYRGVDGDDVTLLVSPGQEVRVLATVVDVDDPNPLDEDGNIVEVTLHWRRTRGGDELTIDMEP